MKKKLISLLCILLLIPSLILTAFASPPPIVDRADLLTDEEETELTKKAQWLRDEYDMDVVILTEDTLNGQVTSDYADRYYDDNGYGFGESGSGVLLILVMDTREWYISTCGEGRSAVSDQDVYELFDWMSEDLSYGNYYEAFDAYLDGLDANYFTYRNSGQSHYDESYDGDDTPVYTENSGLDIGEILLSVLIGLVAGGIGLLILRGMMNSKRPQHSATDYLNRNSYHLRVQRDIFLYSRVHKTAKPKDTGSGSRGGGSRSHGGGGGRF